MSVDGATRGVTPLALRDLALGSRTIAVARRGYIAEERRVVLTRTRPSRSLEIRLTAAASATAGRAGAIAPKPAGSQAAAGGPAIASTGTLIVESRPSGAAVMIDGQPHGVTPATIAALAPGDHRVNLSLAGYQPFATTARVVALSDFTSGRDPQEVWDALTIERRRAVVRELVVVTALAGQKPGGRFNPESVQIEWRVQP